LHRYDHYINTIVTFDFANYVAKPHCFVGSRVGWHECSSV